MLAYGLWREPVPHGRKMVYHGKVVAEGDQMLDQRCPDESGDPRYENPPFLI